MAGSGLMPPDAERQVDVHQLLLIARKVWLSDALKDAMNNVSPTTLRQQIDLYVPQPAQKVLAVAGIRDEAVFPVPVVIESKPTLIAYYRLLLGVSQKRFYTASTGMTPFRRLEDGAPLRGPVRAQLPAFCRSMCLALSEVILQVDDALEARDVEALQLLTLGSYFYGSLNNKIGAAATLGVFTAISEIVEQFIETQGANELQLGMPDGRRIKVVVASDPDVRIVEIDRGRERALVSIEIKGGTDKANVYNRGGEAEKSHQGARARGYETCWTVINTSNVDMQKLMQGSPSTNAWFDTNELVGQTGQDWARFQAAVLDAIGIPV